jgi:TP901 family phage tail tape measure protein
VNSILNIQIRITTAQAQAALAAIRAQLTALGGRMTGATMQTDGFGVALGNTLNRMTSFGSRTQWLGRQLEYNFTLPIVAAAAAAMKFELANETALVRIQKVYGDGTQTVAQMTNEINALRKAFVLLSDEFGVSQADVLNIAADWAAAGVSGIALAKSVQLTLQTMILGEQTAAEATQSLISIQAQYGQSITELATTIDILNMVENQTGVSMQGLIEGFQRSASTAATYGISARYLAADIAALVPTAATASQAGNALKTILTRLMSPTASVSSALKDMGINTNAMSFEQLNAQQRLLTVAKAYSTLSDAQKGFVGKQIAGIYQVTRFNQLMVELNSSTGYYAKALASTADKTKVYAQAQKELNQVLNSNPQRLKEIWVTLQNAMADIIQPMIPTILYLAQSVARLATWFANLNPAVQKFILFGLLILAGIGPVLRIFGALEILIAEVAKGFLWLFGLGRWLVLGIVSIAGGIVDALIAVGTFLVGWPGLIVAAVIAVFVVFWNDIKQGWQNFVQWLQKYFDLSTIFKPLADAANAVVNFVLSAFNALPKGIQSAMIAVVDTIAAAAHAIYGWFQHINPWQRHSPSHVDNVTTGVAAIKTQYEELHDVGSTFQKAGGDLKAFAAAVREVEAAAQAADYAAIRKELLSIAKDAVPAFDALIKDLKPLNAELDAVNTRLQAQQAIVNALKTELDAANDSLTLQKDILDGMKNAMDGFSNKVAMINGDIETLSGIQKSLREAGAGSDILGAYDAQLNALQGQKKGINDQLAAATAAYTTQKALVDSLTVSRDALQLTYDSENASLDKIQAQYDQIKTQIDAITQAISDFDSAAQKLASNAAKKTSAGGVDQFAAGAGANFPSVTGGGKLGRELPGIPDQSAMIDQFTQDLSKKMGGMFGGFSLDFLSPVKRGWNSAMSWLGKEVGPSLGAVGKGFSSMFKGIGNPFKGVDFGGYIDTVKDLFGSIALFASRAWKLLWPPISGIIQVIGTAFKDAWKTILPQIKQFKDLIGPIGTLLSDLWQAIKPLAEIIGGLLLGAFSILAEVLKDVLSPVLGFIIDMIKMVIRVIRGIVEIIVGLLTGDIGLALHGLKDLVFGLFWGIVSFFKNFGLIVWGLFKGIVLGIWNFFVWLYDELIGHSIIPDMVNGIIGFFTMLKDVAIAIWNAFITGLKAIWNKVLKPLFEAIGLIISGIVDIFKATVAAVKGHWNQFITLVQSARDKFKAAIGIIAGVIGNIAGGFKTAYNTVKGWVDKLVSAVTGIPGRIKAAASTMWDGMKNAAKSVFNSIADIWNKTLGKVNFKIPSWIPGIGGDSFSFPQMPKFAQGGRIVNEATAIVGEGRRGFPEFVIPTDPIYRDNARLLFDQLGKQLGIDITTPFSATGVKYYQAGGMFNGVGSMSMTKTPTGVRLQSTITHNVYHFHGDLSFPNVKNGGDAEAFIRNLQVSVGS